MSAICFDFDIAIDNICLNLLYIISRLIQVIGAISGAEVLIWICNNYAKLFSGHRILHFVYCLRRKHRFFYKQLKSPSRRGWLDLVLSLKEINPFQFCKKSFQICLPLVLYDEQISHAVMCSMHKLHNAYLWIDTEKCSCFLITGKWCNACRTIWHGSHDCCRAEPSYCNGCMNWNLFPRSTDLGKNI
jgi:hypothetical protein